MTVAALAHRVDGAGAPLLLLNGGFMTIASWAAIAERLAERFTVVRCDLRGQLSSPAAPPADLAGHVADVVALLDQLALDRVHLVGTSFGAEVALLLAATHGRRVASLVAATATDLVTEEMAAGIAALRRACRAALDGGDRTLLMTRLLPITYSPTFLAANAVELDARCRQVAALPDAFFAGGDGLLAAMEGLDLRPHLPRIACPTLVISASLDQIMPAERSRALAAAIPGTRHVTVDDCGHALVVERPERFVDLVLNHLAGVADA